MRSRLIGDGKQDDIRSRLIGDGKQDDIGSSLIGDGLNQMCNFNPVPCWLFFVERTQYTMA